VPSLRETSQSLDTACCLVQSAHKQTLPREQLTCRSTPGATRLGSVTASLS
jgi:hypothetical protein